MAVLVLFVALVTRIAWLSDDSLITLRTALNITHGWGPGFNATEAVQGYTHPLWFLLWTGIGALTNQWVLGVFALSIALSTFAVALVLWQARSLAMLIVVSGLLLFSNAFMEYSTSGLENPLSYLFIALAFLLTTRLNSAAKTSTHIYILSGLTIAGIFLTRMDLILLVAPPALYLLWKQRTNWRATLAIAISALIPIALWFTWTRFTYSAWLPNTFDAKANLDIPQSELLIQGFKYFWVSFENDPITFVGIVLGLVIAIAVKNPLNRSWAFGIAAYLGYVWWIGGDFMAGRFLAVPLLVAVFILSTTQFPHFSPVLAGVGVSSLVAFTAIAGAAPVSLTNTQEQRWEYGSNLNANVVDERSFYIQNNRGLKFFFDNINTASPNPLIVPVNAVNPQIRTLNEINHMAQNGPENAGEFSTPDGVLVECGLLGTIGLAIGPRNHLIDTCALTDRVLASIPFTFNPSQGWKPGHFERELPAGYQEAVATNNPGLVADPALREQVTILWEKIRP